MRRVTIRFLNIGLIVTLLALAASVACAASFPTVYPVVKTQGVRIDQAEGWPKEIQHGQGIQITHGQLEAEDIGVLRAMKIRYHLYLDDQKIIPSLIGAPILSVEARNATELESGAFSSCTSLEKIALPKVTKVGSYAFARCESLKLAVLQSAVEVGDNAFENCHDAELIMLPKAERVGDNAFGFCHDLEYVMLPSLKRIGANPFMDCRDLKVLVLGESPPGFHPRSFERAARDGLTLIVPDASKYGALPENMPQMTQVYE